MQVFKLMQDRLQNKVQDVRFIFVSVDPERDTLEELKSYTGYFNPDFLGVTGSHAQLARLTRQLGILYVRGKQSKDGKYYLVDHSASVILVDPAGNYRALFSPPHDADAMTASFLKIHAYYEGEGPQ
jgi:protein SCO1/2